MSKAALSLVLCQLALSVAYGGVADRIVAVVADQPILQSQVDAGVEMLRFSMPPPESGQAQIPDSVLKKQVLEQLISDQVILVQAKVESINVTKDQVDDELEQTIKNVKGRFSTPDSYALALAREGITELALRQRYRSEITQRLTAQQLLAKHNLLENVLVAPTEVQQYYRTHRDSFGIVPGRVKLAHILIVPKPSEQLEQKAYEQIVQAYSGLVQSGWDFDAIASSFTTDEEVKRKSGLVGTVRRGELPEEVEAAVFALKPGDFSQPFRSRLGWMIVKREKGTGDEATVREVLIRVTVTGADSTRARNLAADLRRRALAGESFETLARHHSDDPTTKESGGELGEFLLKGLAPPYSTAIENLKAGDISQPILSEHGYHIIKIEDRVEEKVPTYEELQEGIRNYLYSQKTKARLDDFIKENAAQISIQRF
jgi:peptidyl-prolyl cis-trans isomerase SurA